MRTGTLRHSNRLSSSLHASGANIFINRMLADQLQLPSIPPSGNGSGGGSGSSSSSGGGSGSGSSSSSGGSSSGDSGGARLPNQGRHVDSDTQPAGSRLDIYHITFRLQSGSSTGTMVHMPSGSVWLSTGCGRWGLSFDAAFLCCYSHDACMGGPEPLGLSFVVNRTPIGTRKVGARGTEGNRACIEAALLNGRSWLLLGPGLLHTHSTSARTPRTDMPGSNRPDPYPVLTQALPVPEDALQLRLPATVEDIPAARWLQGYEPCPSILICNFHDPEQAGADRLSMCTASAGVLHCLKQAELVLLMLHGLLLMVCFLRKKSSCCCLK